MAIEFVKGGPTVDVTRLADWVDELQPAADKASGMQAIAMPMIDHVYPVTYVSAEALAEMRLMDGTHHQVWRALATHGDVPHGEIEFDKDNIPIAVHKGPGKLGLMQAISVAEESGLSGHEASVIQAPSVRFVGLLLRGSEDMMIAYEPNLSAVPNYKPIPAMQAAELLADAAREVLEQSAGDEQSGG